MRRCSPSDLIWQSRSEPVSDPRDIATGKSFKSLERNFEPVKQAANFSFVAVWLALGRRVQQQLGIIQAAKDPLSKGSKVKRVKRVKPYICIILFKQASVPNISACGCVLRETVSPPHPFPCSSSTRPDSPHGSSLGKTHFQPQGRQNGVEARKTRISTTR